MYEKFKFDRIPLSLINLDDRNPRIVTQTKLETEDEIVRYFFEHQDLGRFLKKIASEGRNPGAEQPYVIKTGKTYTVVEGNTRIATYKLLTGQISAPPEFASDVPLISNALKEGLLSVDCSIAPSRDALLPIMASAHFGNGDKSRWGYLGSRKAVYDEWQSGRSIQQLATAFDRKPALIRDLIVEYQLYLEALKLPWTNAEKAELLDPGVEFNPPVRFLQTSGHKSSTGISLDRVNMKVDFEAADSLAKFEHLVRKLVIESEKGMGATASYAEVFLDYHPAADPTDEANEAPAPTGTASGPDTTGGGSAPSPEAESADDVEAHGAEPVGAAGGSPKLKTGALFDYPVSNDSLVLKQVMKEAKSLNTKTFPAAGTALIRTLMEVLLKLIIDDQDGNKENKPLSLESSLNIAAGKSIVLAKSDKDILKEFAKSHLDYVNLGVHGNVVPNYHRLLSVRDCVDQFVKRNV